MSIRVSWPTRWSQLDPRPIGPLNLRLLVKEGRLYHLLLLLGSLSVLATIFLLLATQDVGVHILCSCDGSTTTGEREARHLAAIMAETDSSTGRSTLQLLKEEHPSLAVEFLLTQEYRGERCPLVPGLFTIRHHNNLWQEASLGSSTLLLYSAYYDDRDVVDGPMVRILAVVDSSRPPTPTCHLYSSGDSPPTATKAIRMDFLHWQYPADGAWQPYLISCRAGSIIPEAVSVVRHACQPATNALLVSHGLAGRHSQQEASSASDGASSLEGEDGAGPAEYKAPPMGRAGGWNQDSSDLEDRAIKKKKKKDLALCHKFLFNPIRDDSLRLIEWLEAARSWGVDHVTLYLHSAPAAVRDLLNLYSDQGFLTVVPWTNPGHHPNAPALQRALYDTQRYALFTLENIPYTDCLLRSMDSHRYVAVWDIDEFLLPAEPFSSLTQMVDHAKVRWYQGHVSTCAQHFSAFDDSTWFEEEELLHLIDQAQEKELPPQCRSPSSYLGRCTYFFDDLAEDDGGPSTHMLHHVTRTAKFAPPLVHTKAIHDTSRALGLHAHFALYTLDGWSDRQHDLYHLYPASEGYLAHYRSTCQAENQTECETLFRPFVVRDERMWQHRDSILEGVARILSKLSLPNLG